MSRFELRPAKRMLDAKNFYPAPQNIQSATAVQVFADAFRRHLPDAGSRCLAEALPSFGLRRFHPGRRIRQGEGGFAGIVLRIALLVQPTVGVKVPADFALEVRFFMQAHISGAL